jgi:MFS family permease
MEHPHPARTLWLTGVLHAFTHIYHVVLLPLYFLILKDPALKLDRIEQSTFLMTAMMFAYFIPAYPAGVLADRFSKKRLLACGLGINGLGFVALALAPSYPMAILSVIIAGLGGCFYHPAATALVARLYPVKTGKALGWVGVGASVGFFIGPLYSGWRAHYSGWRAPVLEAGIAGMVAAIVFLFLADDEPPHPAEHHEQRRQSLFPSPALWTLFILSSLAFCFRDFTGNSMGSLGSLFLQKARGLDTEATGKILSSIFLASAISNPLFGGLSDKNQTFWLSFVLVIASVMVALFPHLPVAWVAPVLAVYGFFFMASFPIVEAALMNSVPHKIRGKVFGFFITITGLVGNLSHWVAGFWVNHLGAAAKFPESYYSTFLMLSGFILVSLLALPCLRGLREGEQRMGALRQSLASEPGIM